MLAPSLSVRLCKEASLSARERPESWRTPCRRDSNRSDEAADGSQGVDDPKGRPFGFKGLGAEAHGSFSASLDAEATHRTRQVLVHFRTISFGYDDDARAEMSRSKLSIRRCDGRSYQCVGQRIVCHARNANDCNHGPGNEGFVFAGRWRLIDRAPQCRLRFGLAFLCGSGVRLKSLRATTSQNRRDIIVIDWCQQLRARLADLQGSRGRSKLMQEHSASSRACFWLPSIVSGSWSLSKRVQK